MPSTTDESAAPLAVLPSAIAAEAIIAAIAGARQAGRREGKAGGPKAAKAAADERVTIEVPPGVAKALKRTRSRAQAVRYRLQQRRTASS